MDLSQPQFPDILLKFLTWFAGGTFTAATAAVVLTWRASSKVTKIDESLKAHEVAAQTHAEKDDREFSLVAKALAEQKTEFSRMSDRFLESSNLIHGLVASTRANVDAINTRFDSIEKQISDLRK